MNKKKTVKKIWNLCAKKSKKENGFFIRMSNLRCCHNPIGTIEARTLMQEMKDFGCFDSMFFTSSDYDFFAVHDVKIFKIREFFLSLPLEVSEEKEFQEEIARDDLPVYHPSNEDCDERFESEKAERNRRRLEEAKNENLGGTTDNSFSNFSGLTQESKKGRYKMDRQYEG